VACAAAKHVFARRRYSSPLLVTMKTPDRRRKRESHPSLNSIHRSARPENDPLGTTRWGQAQTVVNTHTIQQG
jgi:hypothetical protein